MFLFACLHPQAMVYIFVVNPDFSVLCEPCKFGTDRIPMFEAYISYIYFLFKLSHLADTVFFVVRKKWSQVTFLHVYHHVMVSIAIYVGILWIPGSVKTCDIFSSHPSSIVVRKHFLI